MLSLNTVTTAIEDYYQNMRRRDGDKRKSGLVPLIIDKEGNIWFLSLFPWYIPNPMSISYSPDTNSDEIKSQIDLILSQKINKSVGLKMSRRR